MTRQAADGPESGLWIDVWNEGYRYLQNPFTRRCEDIKQNQGGT